MTSMKLAKCSIRTDLPMCWGAPCEANATHPDRAICQCPVQTMQSKPVLLDRFLVSPSYECGASLVPSTCDQLRTSGLGWMATVVGAFAPEAYVDMMACNWIP